MTLSVPRAATTRDSSTCRKMICIEFLCVRSRGSRSFENMHCTASLYGDLWLQSQLLSWEGKGKMQLEVTEDDAVVEIRQN